MAKYEVRLDWWVPCVCTVEVNVPDEVLQAVPSFRRFDLVKAAAIWVAENEGGYDGQKTIWDAATATFVGEITAIDGAPPIAVPESEAEEVL